jgi:hypothetical protein
VLCSRPKKELLLVHLTHIPAYFCLGYAIPLVRSQERRLSAQWWANFYFQYEALTTDPCFMAASIECSSRSRGAIGFCSAFENCTGDQPAFEPLMIKMPV